MKKITFILSLGLLIVSRGYSQQHTDLTNLKFSVAEAPEWTAMLKRHSGWFGGDGIFTIPLSGVANKMTPDGKVLFIFSDTMIGEIRDSTLLPGSKMIHNSYAILNGATPAENEMSFYWHTNKKDKPETVFMPKTPQSKPGDYFWLGSGFVDQELNNNIYIFGYRIVTFGTGGFDFKEAGNTIIKIPAGHLADTAAQKQWDTPFYISGNKPGDNGSFGAGIYVNTKKSGATAADGYVYVYGVQGKQKDLLVARVLPADFEKFNKWKFWDGSNWNSEVSKSVKVTDGVSNELSLSRLPDGRYALIFQMSGMNTNIGMRIGKTPYGPFGPPIKVWDCKKDLVGKDFFVYNAKAHPSLSKPGELLISYNVNSFSFFKDIVKYPNLYRPRFIRVKFE